MILLNGKRYRPGQPFTTPDGTQYPGNWYSSVSPEQRAALGFTEVAEPTNPNPKFYNMNSDGTISAKPLDQAKNIAKQDISAIRYSKENSGIIYNNSLFATDEISRINYLGAVSQAQANNQLTLRWKVKEPANNDSKFVTLDANTIIAIYGSGLHYITSCFYTEDYYVNLIDSAPDLNTVIAIHNDRETGWPSNNY